MSQESPDSSSKPKQLKFPNQVYIDLPLWRDEPQSPGGLGDGGVGAGGQGGQAEVADDPSTTTSTSSASTTPQHTPTNSLKRTSARRKTDSVLYGCGSLLASLVLGYDIREALKSSVPGDECDPPREEKEKKKKEGLFQRATRFRRSTSPPGGRSRRDEASPSQQGVAQPVNLISMSAIIECNSTKCLLQSEAEVSQSSPGKAEPAVVAHHTEPLRVGSGACTEGRSPTPTTNATQTTSQTQSQPTETSKHNTGSRLRRKKYHNNHNSEPNLRKYQHPLFVFLPVLLMLCCLFAANGQPALSPPATQKKDGAAEKVSGGQGLSRPRPVSFRAKPHVWALLRGRNKSYSLGHYSGERAAQNLSMVLSSEGCSLLDMDTEGQKRDCTVPLCRIQSSPARPSVFELEKEFLS